MFYGRDYTFAVVEFNFAVPPRNDGSNGSFVVMSKTHHSTAVLLKTIAIDISFASTGDTRRSRRLRLCAPLRVEEGVSDKEKPRLRTARWR